MILFCSNKLGLSYVLTEDNNCEWTFMHCIKLFLEKYCENPEFLKNT